MNAGGVAAVVDYVGDTRGNVRLPGIMMLGYVAAHSENLAMAVIVSKVSLLCMYVCMYVCMCVCVWIMIHFSYCVLIGCCSACSSTLRGNQGSYPGESGGLFRITISDNIVYY